MLLSFDAIGTQRVSNIKDGDLHQLEGSAPEFRHNAVCVRVLRIWPLLVPVRKKATVDGRHVLENLFAVPSTQVAGLPQLP